MSGILGTYYLDNRPARREELYAIARETEHRGQDGSEFWADGPVGLGHQMLYTTPESLQETLPLISDDGNIVLTADARIDNRDDLIKQADPPGRLNRAVTDAELILAAYRKWGVRCPEYLLGDFAFAVWDASRKRLFCARDPFGVRPFYYHVMPGRRFAFASEIKGLFALGDVSAEINDVEIGRHLLLPIPSEAAATSFRDISALQPAHSMTVDESGIRSSRYWDLDPDRTITLSSDEEYGEAFREIFVESVRARVRSAFPVLTMLSGGMDSSSITCTAAAIGSEGIGRKYHTFSAVFDEVPDSDERDYVSAVLGMYDGLIPHYFHADRANPMEDMSVIHRCQESPPFGNIHINWNAFQTAQSCGARVVLDGFDGDNVVSHGLGYFSELARRKRFLKLALEVRAYAITKGQPWKPAVRAWLKGYMTGPLRRRIGLGRLRDQLGLGRGSVPAIPHALNSPSWTEGLNVRFADEMSSHIHHAPTPRSQRDEQLAALRNAANSHICEMQNKCAAYLATEPAYPFFDRRLVEFCLALPPEQKIRRGRTRIVLRNAMTGILPEKVRTRPFKSNLEPGFNYSVRKFAMEELREAVCSESPELERYVDRNMLQNIHAKYVASTEKAAERQLLLNSVALRAWLQDVAGSNRTTTKVRFDAYAV